MKLYEYYRSSCSYRLRIALNLKNIEVEHFHINLLEKENLTAEYKKINPQGSVPTLIDGDIAIYQSTAALEYLEETHPNPPLLPKNSADRAYVRSLSHLVASGIQPFNNLSALNYLKDELNITDEQKNTWYKHWTQKGLASFESMLTKSGKFCLGDKVTMADICLVPQIYNANRFDCDLSDMPKVCAINDACLALPEFDKAKPENNKP